MSGVGCRLPGMKGGVQGKRQSSAYWMLAGRGRKWGRERKRECERGLFIYLFLAFKTDGSLCAERKCLLTQLAHYWWLPANDNNGIGKSVSNSAAQLSSDDLRTEGWQPADTVARPPRSGPSPITPHGGTHPASAAPSVGRTEAESFESRVLNPEVIH